MIQGKCVKIIIHADGSCSIDAVNFTDATCTQATRHILTVLGGTTTEDRLKPEAQRLPPQANRPMEASR
jgi:hypothetical protein